MKVEWLQDDEYKVIEYKINSFLNNEYPIILFQGSLSDYRAYIDLKERGYLD